MASVTLTLSGSSSVLNANFFPPIELESEYEYECGLIDFQSFHSIPNIDASMNRITIGNKEIIIPMKLKNRFHKRRYHCTYFGLCKSKDKSKSDQYI